MAPPYDDAVEWMLDLASWIIQDGNYDDVKRGDTLEAAVEFGLQGPHTMVERQQLATRHVEGATYDVAGRVVVVEPDVWAIDIGIVVFNEAKPPPGIAVGDHIAGRVWLGVDPFFYFERLHAHPSMPPLIYTWNVTGIARQSAPFVETSPRCFVRDPEKLGWEVIERTNAWADDGGSADYLLTCELRPSAPTRTRARL